MLFELRFMAINQGVYSINVQEFTKYLTCALALIRTFSCKQQKPAEAGDNENGIYYKHARYSMEPRRGNAGGLRMAWDKEPEC